MSNNKQSEELNEITVEATQGLSMEDRDASTTYTTPIIDETTIGFLLDCAERGEIRGKQPSPSICKVSRILRDDNEISYEPQLVSIGPIHREDPKLQEFEWLKECYLNDLLSSCDSPKKTLEACLQEINTLIPKIRESYAGVKKNYSDVELARMMVMDGCFILEFCFKRHRNLHLLSRMQRNRIAMDLMLLENQVPFFVLQALFDCSMGRVTYFTLSEILDKYSASYTKIFRRLPEKNSILSNVLNKFLAPIKLYFSPLPEKISTTKFDSDSTHDHVLGYLHNSYKLVAAKSSNPKHAEASKKPPFFLNACSPKKLCSSFCKIFRKCTWTCVMAPSRHAEASKHVDEAFHSIVELDRSGMNFKPHQEDEWSMTIKFQSPRFSCLPLFWGKPTLIMPTLVIHDDTELILRNFIAYEQSFPKVDHYYFTSYAYAMDNLIDTQEDIAKLVESKVLVNMLGSNQEAADMINKLCKNMIIAYFYYKQEFKQVDKYYNHFWPKNIAKLRRIYFSNPWSTIALLAAMILFGLTVVQTIFTIKAA